MLRFTAEAMQFGFTLLPFAVLCTVLTLGATHARQMLGGLFISAPVATVSAVLSDISSIGWDRLS